MSRWHIGLVCLGAACVQAEIYRCKDAAGATGFSDRPCSGSGERQVEVPPLPKVDVGTLTSVLPKDAQGRPIVGSTGPGGADLVLERQKEPGPVNALARCSVLVTYCYAPGKRDLDACFFSVPRCHTNQPWKEMEGNRRLLPETCWNRYEAARHQGQAPLAALDSVLFGGAGCIPGPRAGID